MPDDSEINIGRTGSTDNLSADKPLGTLGDQLFYRKTTGICLTDDGYKTVTER